MKNILLCLVSLLGILGVGCQTGPGGGKAPRAEVVRTSGTAELRRANEWQSLKPGEFLVEGDQVRTDADGEIEIQFSPHGGVMSVQPDSLLQVEQLGPTATNQQVLAVVQLSRGRVIGDTLKLPKGSKVMVRTRGGSFTIP